VAERRSVAILVAVLVVAALLVALKLALAQDTSAGSDGSEAQIVAAVPAESVTEYEPDPFEPERLRSSTVRVRTVAVVYSDGTIEIKQCP